MIAPNAKIVAVCLGVAGLFHTSDARAQAAVLPVAPHVSAERQTLDSLRSATEAALASPNLTAIQKDSLQQRLNRLVGRLEDGDFQPGDRILITVAHDSALSDTFTVQSQRALWLPKLPPISLRGVLRPELQPYLADQLAKYVKDTLVRATPLVLVGILGQVTRPGYYRLSLETPLGEALMAAGGPTPQADITHTTVRRGNRTIVSASTVRDAMVRRLPLSAIGVDPGDELVVAPPHTRNWGMIVQVLSVGTGLLLSLRALRVF